jgi:multidrug efflux pump
MANLSSICIERPVLTTVISIIITLLGVIGFTFLEVREYPTAESPIVNVTTNYVGASADVIENQITEPLEESINGIAGIRTLTSVSREGRSTISVEFDLEVDLEAAANDVRDRVSRAQGRLPKDVDPPIVAKSDADAFPIIVLRLSSDQKNILEISDLADRTFKERLQTMQGVSEVRIWGDQRYSMRLWMNPEKLASFRLTPLDVRNALLKENVELPSGRVEGNKTELTVFTEGRLRTVKDFENLILKEEGNRVVRFTDVGYVTLSTENERSILKQDGVPGVGVAITTQPGANQLEVAEEFYRRLEQIKKELPEDVKAVVGFDTTKYIQKSIEEVKETIISAFILVVLIMFLFLRDWRSTIIPVLTVPISLIGTFFVMYLMDFSVNVLTLLGMVLAIGLLVDDTIVVLENIYTKIEKGQKPRAAAHEGTEEVFFAVIATTVVLVVVFLPVIFLQGITGKLFKEFGLVIAVSVIISSFVALTLTPMLSARLLKKSEKPTWFYRMTEPFFVWLTQKYADSLYSFMKVRWISLIVLAVCGYCIVQIGGLLKSELAPLEDREGFRVMVTGPEGATFEYMDEYMDSLIYVLQNNAQEGEISGLISVTSPNFAASGAVNSGFMRVILSPSETRQRSQQELVETLTPLMMRLPAARAYTIQEPTISSNKRGGLPVSFVIQASTLEKLKEKLPVFLQTASQRPEFSFVDTDLKFNKPEIELEIDREKARISGVSVLDIAQTLQLAYSGQRFDYFVMNGKQYQIIGQMDRVNRNDPLDFKSLYVRGSGNNLVQLDNLVEMRERSTPPQLYRFNRYVSATVSAQLAKGYTLGQGINAMNEVAEQVLDDTYSTALSGLSKDFADSSSNLLFAFLVAILLSYLILAAQFESFTDPLVIMFTVPMALFGAIFTLWYFEQTLNIFSQIGIIMLVGLVTKNGILIVEFSNQRKEDGLSVLEAVTDASVSRFRPILMTALSTILGILPIALAWGAGSESRSSMGIAVVGGMTFATLLTLYVVPAMYSYLSKKTVPKMAEVS